MSVKLLSEGVAAWAAIVLSAGGGIYMSAHNGGVAAERMSQIEDHQASTDQHITKHDEQLSTIQQQTARMDQKLDDVVSTVHNIQDSVNGRHR